MCPFGVFCAQESTVVDRQEPVGGDPTERNETMVLRLGGWTTEVPLYDLTLEVRPPAHAVGATPISWRGVVAVLNPGRPTAPP